MFLCSRFLKRKREREMDDKRPFEYECHYTPKSDKFLKEGGHTKRFFCHYQNIHRVPFKNDPPEDHEQYRKEELDFERKGLTEKMVYRNMVSPSKKTPEPGNDIDDDILKNFFQDELFTTLQELEDFSRGYPIDFFGTSWRPRSTLSFGQLKLFLAVLQFLLYYTDPDEEVHVIYPGSAPGSTLPLIFELFPMTYWYLYDPSSFDPRIKDYPNVIVQENEFFTVNTCKMLKRKLKGKTVLLISDIRTLDPEVDDIKEDMERQKQWVETLHPDYAQLKFRSWSYFEDPDDKNFVYFDGVAYLQSYAKHHSAEIRLVVDGTDKEFKYKEWDGYKMENAVFLFNTLLRPAHYETRVKHWLLGHCHDCVSFIKLMQDYKKFGPRTPMKNMSATNLITYVVDSIPGAEKKLLDFTNIWKKTYRELL